MNRQPTPPASVSGRSQRLPVPSSGEPPAVPQARRTLPPQQLRPAQEQRATRGVREPARDLAAAVEPPFVPARGDAALVAVRDRIAAELVKAHDLSPATTPTGVIADLEGSTVRITAARLPAAPLAVTVPFAGAGWAARLRATDWSDRGTATLVYELRRHSPDRF